MNLDAKKAVVLVLLAFFAMSAWNNPSGTAESFSSFLGDVGGWAEDLVDKASEFAEGLFG